MNTLSKRAHRSHSQKQKEGQAVATIVQYDEGRGTVNAYPDRIISPTHPSECCFSGMEQVGDVGEDGSWLFIYKRCRTCGYTVRHVLMMSPKAMRTMRDDLLRSMDPKHGQN